MLSYVIVILFAFLGGLTQTVTGFGAAIVMMLAFPYFFDITKAPALASAIGLFVSGSLCFKFRKKIDLKISGWPTAIYTGISLLVILIIKYLNIDALRIGYGVFLIVLALYYFIFSGKVKMSGRWPSMLFASGISGIACGLFGIGGPLMAVYYSDITQASEVYLANIQFNFFLGNLISLITRIVRGIYTPDLIVYNLIGFIGMFAGRQLGLRITGKINAVTLKKIIYIFVAISGIITILK